MLQKDYVDSMQQRFLVIQSLPEKDNDFQEKMLNFNNPKGLLNFELRSMDNNNVYYYDITSLQTLESAFTKNPPNSTVLNDILSKITAAILCGSEYFLEEDDFVISLDSIFVDEKLEEIKLCAYPGYGKNMRLQLKTFFEELMNIIDYRDERTVVYVYSKYRQTQEEGCTFSRLLEDDSYESANYDEVIDQVAVFDNAEKSSFEDDFVKITVSDERTPTQSKEEASRVARNENNEIRVRKPRITQTKQEFKSKQEQPIVQEFKSRQENRAKQDSLIKQESSINKEPKLRQDNRAKQDSPIKQESSINKELKLRQDNSAKQDSLTKQEPSINKELKLRQESRTNQRSRVKQESSINQESRMKRESQAKNEHNFRRESNEAAGLDASRKSDKLISSSEENPNRYTTNRNGRNRYNCNKNRVIRDLDSYYQSNINKQSNETNSKQQNNENKKQALITKATIALSCLIIAMTLFYAVSNNMFIYPNGKFDAKRIIIVVMIVALLGFVILRSFKSLKNQKNQVYNRRSSAQTDFEKETEHKNYLFGNNSELITMDTEVDDSLFSLAKKSNNKNSGAIDFNDNANTGIEYEDYTSEEIEYDDYSNRVKEQNNSINIGIEHSDYSNSKKQYDNNTSIGIEYDDYSNSKKEYDNNTNIGIEHDEYDDYSSEERITAFVETDNETVLLKNMNKACFYLEQQGNRVFNRIIINRTPFYVGSSQNQSDGIINANTISRRHALFEQNGEEIYITDINSKNGTYVNESKLCPLEKVRLLADDYIMFADKIFVLRRM